MLNVTRVKMLGLTRRVASTSLYQYDYGQILIIEDLPLPEWYEVHFCNVGDAETVTAIGDANGVPIPDCYLKTGLDVMAYIFLHEETTDGETEYQIRIPVIQRPEPTDIEPTPEQQSQIDELIAALNAGVERSDDNAESAEQSASDAEAWAVGERAGVHVEPPDETYQNNSKWWAQVAQQGATGAGYAWFDVLDSDGCMWVTITPDLGEDISFHVNENTGELEVIY